MTQEQLNLANIHNLTLLWKNMGAEKIADNLYRSLNWPNRLWLEPGAEIQTLLRHTASPEALYKIPVWGMEENQAATLISKLEAEGYTESFAQMAMSLDLHHSDLKRNSVFSCDIIRNKTDILQWVTINENAFGYSIDPHVIQHIATDPNTTLFLHRINQKPVAAAMTFIDSDVAGIHMVGVLPEYRRQGIARKVMDAVLFFIGEAGTRYCTLQASPFGRKLYLELGFKEDFLIRTYQRSGVS